LGAILLHKVTQQSGHTGGIFECVMLMNGELCVIIVLLVNLKSLMVQRLTMSAPLKKIWRWILEAWS
jgi:hypothetical protein